MLDSSWVHAFLTDIGKMSIGNVFSDDAALISLLNLPGVTKLKDDIDVNGKDGAMANFDLTQGDKFPVIPDSPALTFSFTFWTLSI